MKLSQVNAEAPWPAESEDLGVSCWTTFGFGDDARLDAVVAVGPALRQVGLVETESYRYMMAK